MPLTSQAFETQPLTVVSHAAAAGLASGTDVNRQSEARAIVSAKDFLAVAEKVVAILPKDGAAVLIGNLSGTQESSEFPVGLARALQLVSSKPVLFVELDEQTTPADSPRAPGQAGLMEVLRGMLGLSEAISATPGSELKILSRGSRGPDDLQLLISSAFRDLIQEARRQFPWVIIHCPALLNQEEGLSMISRADAVIGTLERGQGRGRDVQAIRQSCITLKTEFLGVVLV